MGPAVGGECCGGEDLAQMEAWEGRENLEPRRGARGMRSAAAGPATVEVVMVAVESEAGCSRTVWAAAVADKMVAGAALKCC